MTSIEELPEVPPCRLRSEDISRLAERIGAIAGFKPGQDIEELVGQLGGNVRPVEFWHAEGRDRGSIRIRDVRDFDIMVPVHTSKARNAFTMAHELGHYILHFLVPRRMQKEVKPFTASRYGTNDAEAECNIFAAALLMPEHEFRAAHARAAGNLATVAETFGVTSTAAEVRAGVLGLTSR